MKLLGAGFSRSGVAGLLGIGFLSNFIALDESHIAKKITIVPYRTRLGLAAASCTTDEERPWAMNLSAHS